MTPFEAKQLDDKLQAEITDRKRIEETLREQANLLSLTHDAIIVCDMDRVIRYWNPGAEELYGWTAEQVIGKVICELLKTVFPVPVEEYVAEVMRTGRLEGELVHSKKDGTQVVVSSRWLLQQDDQGSPVGFLVSNYDITERKRAEEALQSSVKELENSISLLGATLESTADGILVINTEGKVVRFNRKFVDMWNISDSDIESLERIPAYEIILDQIKTPKTFLEEVNELYGQSEVDSFVVLELTDGRIFECYYQPQRIGETIVGMVWSFRDITERKLTDEELRRNEAYLAEAQRLTHTGSWAYKAEGIVYWSEEMFRIFGFDPKEGYPSIDKFFERIHPADRDWLRERIHAVLGEKVDHAHEHRIVLPDGSVKHIHVTGHPVLNAAGDVVEVVGTLVDITERKQAEEALQMTQVELEHIARVATLGEMMTSIAHEINQPLAAIVNNASACLRWIEVQNLDEARQCVSLVIEDSHRASKIIGRIRALVKKVPPEKDWIDINETIQEVIILMQSEVQRNHVSLKTQFSGDLPLISADRIQLQQVILNLMINAIEAMSAVGEGPRELWVSSEIVESSEILISVRDLGPGLDPKSLDHLFDAFYTTKTQGLGMGLPISRSIVESHGGRLWATANVPHGAVFQFTLPIGSGRVS